MTLAAQSLAGLKRLDRAEEFMHLPEWGLGPSWLLGTLGDWGRWILSLIGNHLGSAVCNHRWTRGEPAPPLEMLKLSTAATLGCFPCPVQEEDGASLVKEALLPAPESKGVRMQWLSAGLRSQADSGLISVSDLLYDLTQLNFLWISLFSPGICQLLYYSLLRFKWIEWNGTPKLLNTLPPIWNSW